MVWLPVLVTHLPNSQGNLETPTRNIKVKVTDGTNPVSGAIVKLIKNNKTVESSKTGSAGGCTLSSVKDGSYIISVTRQGYVDYTDTVTTSVDNASLIIELTATTIP